MTNPIVPTPITELPPAPLVTDTPEQFDDKAFPFAASLDGMRDGMNSAASATYQNAVASNERAAAAQASQGVATTEANRATAQAGIATTKAGEASASAIQASVEKNLAQQAVADAAVQVGLAAAQAVRAEDEADRAQETVIRAVLSYPDYATAEAAAATLPDGQAVVSDSDEVTGVVSGGAITEEQSVYKTNDYARIRGYAGRGTRLRVVDLTGAHWWVRRGVKGDNGGTVLVDSLGRSWEREFYGSMDAAWFGASPTASGAENTSAIQRAIDAQHTSGGGVVMIPAGTINLTATTSAENWETYNGLGQVVALGSGTCGIILRDKVYLRGAGINATTLRVPANSSLRVIYVNPCPNGYGIADMTVDGAWNGVAEVNSHGIYWVTPTIADEANSIFADGVIRNVRAMDVASYGFALQSGVSINNLFDNIKTLRTGSDGFDVKNRHGNRGNRITSPTISAFGLRASLTGQAGIDIMGDGWSIHSPRVINFGRPDSTFAGIRLKAHGGTNGTSPAERSFVTSFIVEATHPNTRGVESWAPNSTIGPGNIKGCGQYGVFNRSNAEGTGENCTVFSVQVEDGGDGAAFISENSGVNGTRWIGCTAINTSIGFRPAGNNEIIVGCVASGVNTPLLTNAGVTNLTVESSPTVRETVVVGTWVPKFKPTVGAFAEITPQVIYAEYIKDGNMVTCNAYLRTNSVDITGASGFLTITELPFPAKAGSYAACSLSELTGWAANPPSSGYVVPGSASINLLSTDPATGISAATPIEALLTGVSSGKNRIILSFTYFIA